MRILQEGYVICADEMSGSRKSHIFPCLCQLSSGTILLTCRRGSDKHSADGNCLLSRSADGGQSWQIICDRFDPSVRGVHGEIRAATLAELDDGTVLAFLSWIDRTGGAELYDDQKDTIAPSHLLLARSRDGGRSFSEHHVLPAGGAKCPALCGPAIRVPGKGWLIPFEKQEPEYGGGPSVHAAEALFSSAGHDFDTVVPVARDGQDRLFFYDQRQDISPAGQPVAAFWTYDRQSERDTDIHLAWGDAESLTWQQPVATGLQGQVAAPIALPDGQLALFYVHRHPPCSMRLVLSPDGGKTWDRQQELIVYAKQTGPEHGMDGKGGYDSLWDDMAVWTFGHPAAVLIEEQTLLLVYYAGENERCLSIRWARIRI